MNAVHSKRVILALAAASLLGSALGCVRTDGSAAYTQTTAGRNWVKNETIERHKTPNGRVILDTHTTLEKFKCIGKDGRALNVSMPEECIKKGGKVYEETTYEETTQRPR